VDCRSDGLSVCRSVDLSVCHSSEPAKTAETIEVTFGLRTRVGQKNYALDGVQIPSWEGALLGEGRPIAKYRDTLDELCKTAEPMKMPFGMWTRVVGKELRIRWCPKAAILRNGRGGRCRATLCRELHKNG